MTEFFTTLTVERFFKMFGITFLAICLSGCASSGIAPGNSDAAAMRKVEVYKLGTGDELRLTVFGEENLSGEFVINRSGNVSIPLIGEVQAASKSLIELKSGIEDALSNGYLKNPRVSVELLNYRPFYVLGEVENSGEYPYSEGMTVLNAVATAGGFTYRANTKTIYIKRSGGNREESYALTATTPVQPGDTIRVSERLF